MSGPDRAVTATGAAAAATNRPVVATIDVPAYETNVALLARIVAPAKLCAVVKADAYGHGAVPLAAAAMHAGAAMVAVAFVDEAVALREAGHAGPVLVLIEPEPDEMSRAVELDLECTVYRERSIDLLERAATDAGRSVRVHLKVDSGMHRLGADPADARPLAGRIAASDHLRFAGLSTHLAVADEPADPFTHVQLDCFDVVRAELAGAGLVPDVVHAANSAAAIAFPRARYDLVRCGIATYGQLPGPGVRGGLEEAAGEGARLSPVLSLTARVHLVRPLAAGERTGYGRRYGLERDGLVAVVPVGYADGVPRALGATGGEVLIRGVRRPIAGTISMDQLIVDLGGDERVRPGDEVVLLGTQGGEEIGAWEWAERTGTIAYEVLTSIGARVPRRLALPTGR